ncbi:peroxisomal biogenesis factor 6 [Verticillium dahliae VdLs.17]|uniref:Peroxisomal ATPase PEX6 n=1 Tax=Verticillium dahliae (strain VdLs.17 / ATCC MYA-4575 / FGSC 10137) TaxID=498257 RepID=G2WYM1_VERDV|nr:peroxisomal biogenesis factor 6 [Verticillium dahliae VdLs.17]EGY21673.1 peroxisomal biogenesis factor 6 [Verticillium dahliae VdLs.17]
MASAILAKRRRRRRRADKPAAAATLLLDGNVKGDVGFLSDDLFADLFPQLSNSIAPWAPTASPTKTSWTLVPVLKNPELGPLYPAVFPEVPGPAVLPHGSAAPGPLQAHGQRPAVALRFSSSMPLPCRSTPSLSNLEKESIKASGNRARAISSTATPTTTPRPRPKGKTATSPEDHLTEALRVALGSVAVIHSGDQFLLPLPPHPVTHVPPNGGEIVMCEPYNQGILTPDTKIVLMRGNVRAKSGRTPAAMAANRGLNGVPEDDEDTANDQFYSAAEERYKTDAQVTEMETVTETEESEASGLEQDDESSDDSMDDMISLQAPMLHTTNASGVSTMQPGSPMTIGRGRRTNGIATPGSVFSSYTATTARPDRPRGRLFKAQGLMEQIPQVLLHPKPTPEDDEEARIFVDISSLLKIGCFSGDWVRVEAAEEPPAHGFGAFGLGGLNSLNALEDGPEPNWRPVRVYSLPEGYTQKPVTRIPSSRHLQRKPSFFESQTQKPTGPAAYISPILLANLESPAYLRLSPLKPSTPQGKRTAAKFSRASHPPFARDITIHQVRSPISVERAYQTVVLAGLKRYFAEKVRIAKAGDLIAVPIDTLLGKMFQDAEVDNIISLSNDTSKANQVAWFKVGHVQAQKRDEDDDLIEDLWKGVACIDSETVGMNLSGFVTARPPASLSSTWEYYTGVKKAPIRSLAAPTPALPSQDQRYISPLRHRLQALLAAATSPAAIHGRMSPVAILLTSTHRYIGKSTVATAACADVGLHTYPIDANDLLSEAEGSGSDVKTEGFLKARAERGLSCGADCTVLLFKHIEGLTADRMVSTMKGLLQESRVLIATTNDVDKLPKGLRSLFTYELEMGAPDEVERAGILRSVVDDMGLDLDLDVEISGVALKTAAFVAGGLVDAVERARIARNLRLEDMSRKASSDNRIVTVRDVEVSGGPQATGCPAARSVTKTDFDVAVEKARKNFAGAIGAPKIPNVTWDDVGGLQYVKDAVKETIQLPLERPELFAKGLKKRSGILFYGPPGTGKTLLAKAIATEYSLNFFSVKGPELLNMYIGESEANVRRVFQKARDARPCVVFFDELDSVAPKRGNQGDSGGVMDRIVSQLLAELDGMSGGSDGGGGVFVIGATNRPDLLDPALLRPGRFDKMLYLSVADTRETQLKILEAVTRKFTLHPSLSLDRVASQLPYHYTGADYYALCSDAMLKAITRQTSSVDAKVAAINAARGPDQHPISTANFFDHHATAEDIAVVVTEEDFLAADRELVPSVSAGELARYETMRRSFEGPAQKEGQEAEVARPGGGAARAVSGESVASSKGKGKAPARDKGKGKALAVDSDDDDDRAPNGRVNKGKGKAAFQHGTADDDDELY